MELFILVAQGRRIISIGHLFKEEHPPPLAGGSDGQAFSTPGIGRTLGGRCWYYTPRCQRHCGPEHGHFQERISLVGRHQLRLFLPTQQCGKKEACPHH